MIFFLFLKNCLLQPLVATGQQVLIYLNSSLIVIIDCLRQNIALSNLYRSSLKFMKYSWKFDYNWTFPTDFYVWEEELNCENPAIHNKDIKKEVSEPSAYISVNFW